MCPSSQPRYGPWLYCVVARRLVSGTKMASGSNVFECTLCDRPDIYCLHSLPVIAFHPSRCTWWCRRRLCTQSMKHRRSIPLTPAGSREEHSLLIKTSSVSCVWYITFNAAHLFISCISTKGRCKAGCFVSTMDGLFFYLKKQTQTTCFVKRLAWNTCIWCMKRISRIDDIRTYMQIFQSHQN